MPNKAYRNEQDGRLSEKSRPLFCFFSTCDFVARSAAWRRSLRRSLRLYIYPETHEVDVRQVYRMTARKLFLPTISTTHSNRSPTSMMRLSWSSYARTFCEKGTKKNKRNRSNILEVSKELQVRTPNGTGTFSRDR